MRLRALLLIITALGLALGLATVSTHDRPVAASAFETVCAVSTDAVGAAATHLTSLTVGSGAETAVDDPTLLLVLAVAAVLALVSFAMLAGRWGLGGLLRRRADVRPRPASGTATLALPGTTLSRLTVLRI